MNQILRRNVLAFYLTILVVILAPRFSSGAENLIVRVVDVEYPPAIRVSEGNNYTLWEFKAHIEIENPTSSIIEGSFICTPFPFPQMEINLDDKNLDVRLEVLFEWPVGNFSIQPGIKKEIKYFAILALDYESEVLPSGEYTIWFNYTWCSNVPVPVETEKLIIYASETNITFYFECSDETKIYTIEHANYAPLAMISIGFIILVVIRKITILRKKGLLT
ncbi:MAG: hypothetical protein KGD64_06560 [Candidatus Heimdallarchaeota archaeon]|nr:hypothetical protein [Candidatus Heimdallarchaeota archaeon]